MKGRLRENGMSCGWFLGATGEAVRKFAGALIGARVEPSDSDHRGRPDDG